MDKEVICSFISQEVPPLGQIVRPLIMDLIKQKKVTTFLVSRRTRFEKAVFDTLIYLKPLYPYIRVIYVPREEETVVEPKISEWPESFEVPGEDFPPIDAEEIARRAGFEIKHAPYDPNSASIFHAPQQDWWMILKSDVVGCYLPFHEGYVYGLVEDAGSAGKDLVWVSRMPALKSRSFWETEVRLRYEFIKPQKIDES